MYDFLNVMNETCAGFSIL